MPLLLSAILPQQAVAVGASQHAVKVGCFPYEDQLVVDADGNMSGYGYDYLQEIARYTGWSYEFVDASWSECLTMLERGEIDLLGEVIRSSDRDRIFDFSADPMISGYGVLATPLDNQTLPYEDFAAFDGLKVGVLNGNLHRESFLQYSQTCGFSPDLRDYTSQAELDAALERGDISAAVMTNLIYSPNLRIIAAFGQTDAYFATTKGNRAILDPLNEALRQIRLDDPYFNSKLDQKYYDLQTQTTVSFTRKELDFIAHCPPIPCVYIPAAPPVSYFDRDANLVQGITVDICRLLEERTGLTFRWLNPTSAGEAVDMLRNGDALLLPGKYFDPNWARKNGVTLTDSYLPGQMVMVTSRQTSDREIVALYDQGSQSQLVASAVSIDAQMKQYPTIIDCMDAVLSGEANTTFINSTVASYLNNNPKYAGLQTNPLYGYSGDLAMAVSGQADPLLLSILNKGLRNISSTEINRVVLSQIKHGQAGQLATYLYLHPVEVVLLLSAIFLALILVLSGLLLIRKKNTKNMHKALYTDPLTGYSNYRSMSLVAQKLIAENPGRYALLYLDIHRFKVINDAFGYDIGDRVLIATSNIIHQVLQPEERFARLYADTFLLLLKFSSADQLRERIGDFSQQLERSLTFEDLDTLKPIFCGGVYPLPAVFDSLDQACDRANYAMDSITHPLSNTFVFYDDIIRNRVLMEKDLENSMSTALERGEFIPFYQPKVNALTEKVIGAEALVRWQHPEKGCLSPGNFLPFYEKNGFVVNIDLSIFEQVCRDLQRWLRSGIPAVPISVNFSRRHIVNKSLPQKLKDIADRYQVPAHLLEVEITETEEFENTELAAGYVFALKALGFNISIDDYGTGYSSVSFLQELPLDALKLDRSFILNAMKTSKAKDIMRYLVDSMHKNEIRVLCEGIETDAQKEFVLGLNCRYIQGYLYSTPLPRQGFEAYLQTHGTDTSDHLDFIPITNLEKSRWSDTNDFLSRVLPSWVVYCLAEPGYPVQYISPNFLEGMGYSALEFSVATAGLFINWIHPDDVEQTLAQLEQNRDARQERSAQYRLRKKDGSYLWIREINKRVIVEGGQEVLLSICTDISDLVALQTEKSQLIETILGGVGTILLTERGPILQQASKHFYDVLGHTQAEMATLDNNLCNIMYGPDLPQTMELMRKTMEACLPSCECMFRICKRDGDTRWVTFRGTISHSQAQTLATVIVYNSDKEMQDKHAADITRAKLELALTLTEHAIFEYDITAKTIYSHSGFGNYGIPDGVIIHIPRDMVATGFIHPDDVEKIQNVHAQIAAGSEHISYEIRVRGKQLQSDPSYIWVRVTLTTIYGKDRQPTQAVGMVEDISRQKHFEHAFKREEQYRRAFTESSLMAYEFNLTKDTIGRITGSRGFRLQELCDTLPNPNNYTEVLQIAAHALVFSADREGFMREASRESLLTLYDNGIFEKELEYRRLTPDGRTLWNSVLIYLVMDPLDGDVMGYSYHRDIHQRKEAERGLLDQASKDPLTGVYNRSTAEKLIEAFLAQLKSTAQMHAFLMLDADQFKKMNDTHGHLLGDRLLVQITQILTRCTGADSIVARMGGDEFAVFLKNVSSTDEVLSIAEQIERDVSEISNAMSLDLATNVSIGVAFMPYHGTNFDALYRHADEAMYRAKKEQDTHIVVSCMEASC